MLRRFINVRQQHGDREPDVSYELMVESSKQASF